VQHPFVWAALTAVMVLAPSSSTKTPSIPRGSGQHLQTIRTDLQMQADDDVKVRIDQPPVQYDAKGHPKKYTSAQLKELKGKETKLPGYPSDFDQLKAGDIVKVTLATKKKSDAASNTDQKWLQSGDIVGTLRKVDLRSRKLTLRVESTTEVPKSKYSAKPSSSGRKSVPKETINEKVAVILILSEGADSKKK
jgi:hypothetical protein